VLSLSDFGGATALAVVQGGLVAAPRAGALDRLHRLRSPVWAVTLPGALLLGTFGPLAAPPLAVALVVLGAVATLPLAAVAVLAVVRGPRFAPVALGLAVGVGGVLAGGSGAQLSATVLTALGCATLGVALARVIPTRFMLAGVVCVAALDIVLLACGTGQTAAATIVAAATHVHAGAFDHAQVERVTLDYPDLVLAAVLGGSLAGRRGQWRAAALVAGFSACCFALAPPGSIFPATVPIALTVLVLRMVGLSRRRRAGERAGTAAATDHGLATQRAARRRLDGADQGLRRTVIEGSRCYV
jgi:hypothetical protein